MSDLEALLRRPSAANRSTQDALGAYGRVSVGARVATASPHELVEMLYAQLLKRLRQAERALAESDTLARLKATESALAIVDGLDATLDRSRAPGVADSLHMVYVCLIERLLAGTAKGLAEASASVESLLDAWRDMGRQLKEAPRHAALT